MCSREIEQYELLYVPGDLRNETGLLLRHTQMYCTSKRKRGGMTFLDDDHKLSSLDCANHHAGAPW